MVRNDGGGNKMKHLARKHVNGASQQQNKFLRVSQCKEEIYGYILRLLGNGMCMVKCVDGYERLCHIRGKFTGRSKRENALSQGTWVLIGLRQWDADKEFALKTSKIPGKSIQKCDLLEIYTPAEREKLRVQEKIFQENADENSGGGGGGGGGDSDDEFRMSKQTVEFKDQATLEYQEIIEQGGKLSRMKKTSYHDIYDGITSDDDSDDDAATTTTDDDDAATTTDDDDATDDDNAPDTSSRQTAIKRSVPDLPKQQQQQQHSSKMVFDEVDIDEI
jgi:initiation factor 1A